MKSIILTIIISLIIFQTNISNATDAIYVWSDNGEAIPTASSLELETPSYVLMESTTGTIISSNNMDEQLHPASVTKIMSILLIMESLSNQTISLTDQVPCSENAASMGGSQIWLDPRETLSVDDMLKAICVASANDCVVAMAEYIAGSEAGFVQMMNDKAKELGMTNTNFVNPHGLDDPNHLTTSHDVALMSCELITKYPEITEYTTIWTDTLRDGKSAISNTNKLLRSYQGISGLKTGSTSLALYNLSATATRDDLSLIAVVMKSPSSQIRFNEAANLLDYGFKNYTFNQYANQGDSVATIHISKSKEEYLELICQTDSGVLVEISRKDDITEEIIANENIEAPILEGDILGEIIFKLDDEIIAKTNLIASKSIPKLSLFNMCSSVISNWANLLR